MKKLRISLVLLVLGALLAGVGAVGLSLGPGLIQYAFLPPADTGGLLDSLSRAQTALAESFPLLTLHGQKSGAALTAGSASQNNVCLYLTGPAWNEVYPRRFLSGRPVSRVDVEQKNPVIVLDRETAFLFFGDRDPLGQSVTLDGTRLEVIGVAEHSRRLGETGSYAAWVPLGTVKDCELMVLSAPAGSRGLLTAFQTAASDAFGAGTVISLPKEGERALMILRWPGLILALWGLMLGIRGYMAFCGRQWRLVREESRRLYAARLLPKALLRLLPAALLGAVLIAAGAGIAVLAVGPAQVFPEWVPESLGDFSTWVSRFWNLTADAAKSVSLRTPELAELRFFGALIRWGVVLMLLSPWKRLFRMKQEDHRG